MEIIERDLLRRLEKHYTSRECLAITGPRQSGKTTLLKLIKQNILEKNLVDEQQVKIISFEDPLQLQQFEDDYQLFLQRHLPDLNTPGWLMLDEFQYVRGGGKLLKLIYDRFSENIKIIVTGSSSLELKNQIGKHLVGRCLFFKLNPFNFVEFLKTQSSELSKLVRQRRNIFKQLLLDKKTKPLPEGKDSLAGELSSLFDRYVTWGGYPRIACEDDREVRFDHLSNLLINYLHKDVKGLLELATDRELLKLSQYLAAQTGKMLVYENLCQKSGLAHRKMKKHLKLLEQTYICQRLRPFHTNRQKELSKRPKIYFQDTGFRNYLLENMTGLDNRTDSGELVENMIWLQLIQLKQINKINFWRTKQGQEVDFIISTREGEKIPIEVKHSPFRPGKIPSGMRKFITEYQPHRAFLFNKDTWSTENIKSTKIHHLPIFYS